MPHRRQPKPGVSWVQVKSLGGLNTLTSEPSDLAEPRASVGLAAICVNSKVTERAGITANTSGPAQQPAAQLSVQPECGGASWSESESHTASLSSAVPSAEIPSEQHSSPRAQVEACTCAIPIETSESTDSTIAISRQAARIFWNRLIRTTFSLAAKGKSSTSWSVGASLQ